MTEKKTLAQKMKALEQIVEKLNKDPEIEEAVKLYEDGVKTAASIREYLETAQTKIRVLTESGEKLVDPEKLGRKE
ncbi:MAG TPA: exodeoxyribonuclease VII small subunit [bacterium]|nr:exodeoxyribonuclease VII small subunit [bacterium]HNZ54115.1 exodeoxyribonuclease VII small subunit [bacterium]HOB71817.1 exodeoxyribonuclease VII small subunit [bacterium]HOG44746.1 exodeoxyribonuclease VII small subunit [bacterium]HPV21285.1 exodeoxyribonuclease VII small subunit [bacterium]